jgi:RNA recognition motif-containing protein
MNIYVGNLTYSFTENELKEMFAPYGEVESAKIIMDKHSGQSKGFGFIEMPSNSEADQAIKALNGNYINGRNIKINPADPGGKKKRGTRKKRRY